MQEVISAATTFEDFVKDANTARKIYKDKWIIIRGAVGIRGINLKTYNTYLQRYYIDGKDYSEGLMEISVKEWNNTLYKGWESALMEAAA